jgi:ARC6-like, IMS domain
MLKFLQQNLKPITIFLLSCILIPILIAVFQPLLNNFFNPIIHAVPTLSQEEAEGKLKDWIQEKGVILNQPFKDSDKARKINTISKLTTGDLKNSMTDTLNRLDDTNYYVPIGEPYVQVKEEIDSKKNDEKIFSVEVRENLSQCIDKNGCKNGKNLIPGRNKQYMYKYTFKFEDARWKISNRDPRVVS